MAGESMILSKFAALEGIVGSPFDLTLELWQDDAQSVPFDLADDGPYSVTLEVDGYATVTEGAGVTVTGNRIDAHLTAEQVPLTRAKPRYRVKLIDAAGESYYPLRGVIVFGGERG